MKRASGEWWEFDGTASNRGLMAGASNVEEHVFTKPGGTTYGVALRAYDAEQNHWSIWWLDSRSMSGRCRRRTSAVSRTASACSTRSSLTAARQSAAASFLLDAQRSTFTYAGDEPQREYGVAALGIAAILPSGWMPYLSVDSIVGGDDMDRYRVSLGLRREL